MDSVVTPSTPKNQGETLYNYFGKTFAKLSQASVDFVIEVLNVPNSPIKLPLHRIGCLIQAFQLMYFIFSDGSVWGSYYSIASTIFGTMQLSLNRLAIESADVLFYICIGYDILIFLLLISWISIFLMIERGLSVKRWIPIMRVNMSFLYTIGLIPALNILFSQIRCQSFLFADNSPYCTFVSSVSVFSAILYCLFALTFSYLDCLPWGDIKSQRAKTYSRIDFVLVFFKILLTVFMHISVIIPSRTVRNALNVSACLVAFSTTGFLFYWFQPYYNRSTGRLWVWITWINAFAAITAIPLVAADIPDNTFAVSLFWIAPVILLLSAMEFDKRASYVLQQDPYKIKNMWILEFNIRLQILQVLSTCSSENERASHVDRLHNILDYYISQNPNKTWIYIFLANIGTTLACERCLYRGIYYLAQINLENGNSDIKLMKERHLRWLKLLSSEEQGKIINFLASEEALINAMSADLSVCKKLLEFWQENSRVIPDAIRLRQVAEDVFHKMKVCLSCYDQLINLVPLSTAPLQLYAGFLDQVVNDSQRATQVVLQSRNISERLTELSRKQESISTTLLDPRVGIVVVKGNENVGEIVTVNERFSEILEFGPSELIGRNINVIVAAPWFDIHDSKLRYFGRYGSSISDRAPVLRVTAINAHGYLIPISFTVKHFNPTMQDVRLIATVQRISCSFEHLYIDENYMITNFSEKISGLLRCNPTDVIPVQSVFPDPAIMDLFQCLINGDDSNRIPSLILATQLGRNDGLVTINVTMLAEPLYIEVFDEAASVENKTATRRSALLHLVFRLPSENPLDDESIFPLKIGVTFPSMIRPGFEELLLRPSKMPSPIYDGEKAKQYLALQEKYVFKRTGYSTALTVGQQALRDGDTAANNAISAQNIEDQKVSDSSRAAETLTAVRIFRRMVIYSESQDKGMSTFRRLFFVVVGIAMALAISTVIISQSQLNDCYNNIGFMITESHLRSRPTEVVSFLYSDFLFKVSEYNGDLRDKLDSPFGNAPEVQNRRVLQIM